MTLIDLLAYLSVAGICGGIGQSLAGFERGGCLGSIAVGLIGAVLGSWLARQLGLSELMSLQIGAKSYPVVWSVIGASLFVGLLTFLAGDRRRSVRDRFEQPSS